MKQKHKQNYIQKHPRDNYYCIIPYRAKTNPKSTRNQANDQGWMHHIYMYVYIYIFVLCLIHIFVQVYSKRGTVDLDPRAYSLQDFQTIAVTSTYGIRFGSWIRALGTSKVIRFGRWTSKCGDRMAKAFRRAVSKNADTRKSFQSLISRGVLKWASYKQHGALRHKVATKNPCEGGPLLGLQKADIFLLSGLRQGGYPRISWGRGKGRPCNFSWPPNALMGGISFPRNPLGL